GLRWDRSSSSTILFSCPRFFFFPIRGFGVLMIKSLRTQDRLPVMDEVEREVGASQNQTARPADSRSDSGAAREPRRYRRHLARNALSNSLLLSPIAERLSDLHDLAQVIGVVISDQQNFAQIRSPFAVRNFSRQIQTRILDQLDDRFEVGEECG